MGSKKRNLAVDVMGADLGPFEVISGVRLALDNFSDLPDVTLVGNSELIEGYMSQLGLAGHPKISVFHASQVITMDEKPIQSLKQKKDSSMVRALELVKDGTCQGMLSCGNTGSLMAGGTLKLRTLPGIKKPALSSVIPSKDHLFVLLDVGADPDPAALQLVHYAIVGSNHCRVALGVESPKVGLLTIGTEEGKGTERVHETHQMLKKIDGLINYAGLIEGFQVFDRDVDVVVCDGFVGNILIKTCESLLQMVTGLFVEEFTRTPIRKVGAKLSKGAFTKVKKTFDPNRYGAAPLLGLNGIVVKAHGSSNCYAVMNAIDAATRMLDQDMNGKIMQDLAQANGIVEQDSGVEAEAVTG